MAAKSLVASVVRSLRLMAQIGQLGCRGLGAVLSLANEGSFRQANPREIEPDFVGRGS
jgi:hypothetical protein